jgi:hypothetical protein
LGYAPRLERESPRPSDGMFKFTFDIRDTGGEKICYTQDWMSIRTFVRP